MLGVLLVDVGGGDSPWVGGTVNVSAGVVLLIFTFEVSLDDIVLRSPLSRMEDLMESSLGLQLFAGLCITGYLQDVSFGRASYFA